MSGAVPLIEVVGLYDENPVPVPTRELDVELLGYGGGTVGNVHGDVELPVPIGAVPTGAVPKKDVLDPGELELVKKPEVEDGKPDPPDPVGENPVGMPVL